jgi:hypothetical protein
MIILIHEGVDMSHDCSQLSCGQHFTFLAFRSMSWCHDYKHETFKLGFDILFINDRR